MNITRPAIKGNAASAHALWALRERSGLSQLRVAGRIGVALNTLRNAERGLGSTRTLSALARLYGVSFETVSGRTPIPTGYVGPEE